MTVNKGRTNRLAHESPLERGSPDQTKHREKVHHSPGGGRVQFGLITLPYQTARYQVFLVHVSTFAPGDGGPLSPQAGQNGPPHWVGWPRLFAVQYQSEKFLPLFISRTHPTSNWPVPRAPQMYRYTCHLRNQEISQTGAECFPNQNRNPTKSCKLRAMKKPAHGFPIPFILLSPGSSYPQEVEGEWVMRSCWCPLPTGVAIGEAARMPVEAKLSG